MSSINFIYKELKKSDSTDLVKSNQNDFVITNKETTNSLSINKYVSNTSISQIFDVVDKNVVNKNETINNQFTKFISLFKSRLSAEQNNLDSLPALLVGENDSNSLTIEWVLPTKRIGFDFESKQDESFYYFVKNTGIEFTTESKKLNDKNYIDVINKSIRWVLE